jgi:ATP/maltotriose-dependent transcriptional regulator MalT
MNLEIAKAEFEMRDSNGNHETAIAALANLNEIEKSARVLGSQKACVSILLIRARVLLYMGQVDTARDATLDAICKSLLNGMRLKRITGLILMSAIMAMRGEIDAAKNLLNSTRLTAIKMRYIRAVLDIDRLRHAIDIEGGVSQWAGYLSEFDVSPSRGGHI